MNIQYKVPLNIGIIKPTPPLKAKVYTLKCVFYPRYTLACRQKVSLTNDITMAKFPLKASLHDKGFMYIKSSLRI